MDGFPPTTEESEITPELELPWGDLDLEPIAESIENLEEEFGRNWNRRLRDVAKNAGKIADAIDLAEKWYENDRNVTLGDYLTEMVGDLIDVVNPLTGDDLASGEIPDWAEEIFPPPQPPPPSGPNPVPDFPRGCSFSLYRSGSYSSSGEATRTATIEEDPSGAGYTFPASAAKEEVYERKRVWSYNLADYHEVRIETETSQFWHDWDPTKVKGEVTSTVLRIVSTISNRTIFSSTISSSAWLNHSGFNDRMGGFTVTSYSSSQYELEVVPNESTKARCRWSPSPSPPPSPPPPPPDDMTSCNCRNIEDMLRKLCAITGVKGGDLPASIPNLADSKKTKVKTIPELIAHFYEQFDAVFGQFPMEVEIEDTDPTTKEKEPAEIKYPNLSEMIADIFSVLVQTNHGVSLIGAGIPRLAVEVISAKNAAIVGESYARANASYLGYRSEQKPIEVGYAFDLEDREDKALIDIYQNTKGKILVQTETDKSSASEVLAKILLSAEMIKATSTRKGPQILEMLDEVLRLRRIVKGSSGEDDEDKDPPSESVSKLLNTINDSSFYQGGATTPRPKASRISQARLEEYQAGERLWDESPSDSQGGDPWD
jgi:hypothetical protein